MSKKVGCSAAATAKKKKALAAAAAASFLSNFQLHCSSFFSALKVHFQLGFYAVVEERAAGEKTSLFENK